MSSGMGRSAIYFLD
jgi:AP-1 complex subunit mu